MTEGRTVSAETLDLAADLTTAYIGYARETITDRALPDVRDGLKPVQRRILYTMKELNLRHDQPHRKCARIVGDCLGKFHPHGDQSVYDALVRMAQPFRMGVPLVDGQGNFGCFTADTKVKLLDGSDRSFEELAQMYALDQVFYVYSIDDEGNVIVGEARNSRVTRKRVEIVELELDNGETIRCTPDHRFMLRDGTYKQAKDLTPDDSLMAGYFTTAPIRSAEFVELAAVYNHRVVAKRYLSERVDVYDITVEPHHNFLLSSGVFVHNSVDGDSAAQMRYTEARLTAVAETMLEHLDMDTVSWQDNFDSTLQEPMVLPGMFPNLLVNGAAGIAVGMSTNMPPHNLGEVCAAVIHLAQNWRRRNRLSVDDMMQLIPGPDFPTGGILYRYRDEGDGRVDMIQKAYETGRGRIVMQARIGVEDIGGGKANIVISQLPYGVLKNTVIEKLAKEIRRGRITGVTDVRDESDYEGMRVVVEISRQATAKEVLPQLLKYSQLRETFGVINLALVPDNGATRPEYLSLRDMLVYFVSHRLDVIVRRSRYELEKRQARLHIVEGLLKALDVLDEVIATIRRSRTVDTARNNLIKNFKFSELQAQAILDMQLRRLTALERNKLVDEEKELKARIRYLEGLLKSEKKRLEVVVEETSAIREQFAVPRRTIIVETEEAGSGTVTTQADLVMPEEPQMLVLTPDGLERYDAKGFSYRGSRTMTKNPVRDMHLAHIAVDPSDEVVLLTNKGRGWRGKVGFVPERGSPQVLGLEHKERVLAIAVVEPESFLILGTQSGKVKRTQVEDLVLLDRQWGPVIGLADDDALLFADVAGAGAHVVFYTRQGQFLRIDGDTVNPQQTDTARGVAGVSLRKGDELLGGAVVPDAAMDEDKWQVVVVSRKGYAHRAPLSEFSLKGRATQGVRCLRPSKSAGPVADVVVGLRGALDVYLEDGRRQRVDLSDIPEGSREVLGKRLFGDKQPVTRLVLLGD